MGWIKLVTISADVAQALRPEMDITEEGPNERHDVTPASGVALAMSMTRSAKACPTQHRVHIFQKVIDGNGDGLPDHHVTIEAGETIPVSTGRMRCSTAEAGAHAMSAAVIHRVGTGDHVVTLMGSINYASARSTPFRTFVSGKVLVGNVDGTPGDEVIVRLADGGYAVYRYAESE